MRVVCRRRHIQIGEVVGSRVLEPKLRGSAPNFISSLFRGDYSPIFKAEQMALLLDSLRKAVLGE